MYSKVSMSVIQVAETADPQKRFEESPTWCHLASQA